MKPHPGASNRFSKRGTALPSLELRGEGACGAGPERWRPDARVKIAALAHAALQLRLAGRRQPMRSSFASARTPAGPPRNPSIGRNAAAGRNETRHRGRPPADRGRIRSRALGPGGAHQLDTPRCSDMLTTPETFEISRGFESSARCVGRGRPASRVAGDSGFRDPNPARVRTRSESAPRRTSTCQQPREMRSQRSGSAPMSVSWAALSRRPLARATRTRSGPSDVGILAAGRRSVAARALQRTRSGWFLGDGWSR